MLPQLHTLPALQRQWGLTFDRCLVQDTLQSVPAKPELEIKSVTPSAIDHRVNPVAEDPYLPANFLCPLTDRGLIGVRQPPAKNHGFDLALPQPSLLIGHHPCCVGLDRRG
jgi:hypothetical protein